MKKMKTKKKKTMELLNEREREREMLVLSTMWIVGVAVEVQVRNGSIYSGICHTARFDQEYGIILRKAKLNDHSQHHLVLDTLLLSSSDIVQVVVKGILLPSHDQQHNSLSHFTNTTATPLHVDMEYASKYQSPPEYHHIHQFQLSTSPANVSLPQPQYRSKVHGCNTSSNDPTPSLLESCSLDFERTTSVGSSMNVCCPSEICVDMSCQLSTSQSASQTPPIATKDSFPCPSSKEFKLNPRAKTFMPMFSTPKSNALPSTVSTMDFISNDPSVIQVAVAPPVNAINSFAPRSSAKFAPYNNMVAIDGDNATQYSQSIVGHVGSRMHSVRYNSQCSPVQAGPAYIHPNSPAVMVGRLGQLVYMHPISHDLIQGSTVPPPVSIRPQLASQVLLPKHQASAAAATGQALQVCVGQSGFVLGGGLQHQQPYALANGIPFHHPVVRPIPTAHLTTNKFV